MAARKAPSYHPKGMMRAEAHIPDLDVYRGIYEGSVANPEFYWGRQALRIPWFKPWDEILSWNFTKPRIEWFKGGKLNASYVCLDQHVEAGRGNDVALIWEPSDPTEPHIKLTYAELLESVQRAANALKALGVKRGDRVCIYLQMIPDLPVAMLACARIGAIHSVVFGAFKGESLRDRINDSGCTVLITQDMGVRGAKLDIPMKQTADEALAGCPTIKHVLVVERTGTDVPMQDGRDHSWVDLVTEADPICEPEHMDAEDPLFILYTSGSTGKPKGVVHTTGGYMVYASLTHQIVFDYHRGQVYWCTADCGWITGHSYVVYGPLANGATTVMFEGVPNYPDHGRFWQIVAKHHVNVLYTAPTALRALMKEGDRWPLAHDLSSLRVLGTVGEPIKAPEWHWYNDVIGKGSRPIVDTWWQTETGGICITPLPGATPTKPGSATLPFFGIQPVIVDDDGTVLEGPNVMGNLCIKYPWPGMMRTVWGDHERFRRTYFERFPGMYFTGDGCFRDDDGYYWLTGRVDDVMKVSGHLIGSAELEGAIGHHPAVAEAAVVGAPHEIKGQGIHAFVMLRTGFEGSDEMMAEIVQEVRDRIGPHATPERIQFVPGLPKTRSGKIMRRVLRAIANGTPDDVGDISTLADPSVVDAIIAGRT